MWFEPKSDSPPPDLTSVRKNLSRADLKPEIGPLDTEVHEGQLTLSNDTSVVLDPVAEAIRLDCADDADRLCIRLHGSNIGETFLRKLNATHQCLKQPMTQSSAVRIGCHLHTLTTMLPALSQRLDELLVAEIVGFADNVRRLLSRFEGWEKFLKQSNRVEEISNDARMAAHRALEIIKEQTDSIVRPDLKQAIEEQLQSDGAIPDQLSSFGLLRSASNIYKSIARMISARLAGIQSATTQAFDKGTGALVGGGAVVGLVALAYEPLKLLLGKHPGEFGWVKPLLDALQVLRNLVL